MCTKGLRLFFLGCVVLPRPLALTQIRRSNERPLTRREDQLAQNSPWGCWSPWIPSSIRSRPPRWEPRRIRCGTRDTDSSFRFQGSGFFFPPRWEVLASGCLAWEIVEMRISKLHLWALQACHWKLAPDSSSIEFRRGPRRGVRDLWAAESQDCGSRISEHSNPNCIAMLLIRHVHSPQYLLRKKRWVYRWSQLLCIKLKMCPSFNSEFCFWACRFGRGNWFIRSFYVSTKAFMLTYL